MKLSHTKVGTKIEVRLTRRETIAAAHHAGVPLSQAGVRAGDVCAALRLMLRRSGHAGEVPLNAEFTLGFGQDGAIAGSTFTFYVKD